MDLEVKDIIVKITQYDDLILEKLKTIDVEIDTMRRLSDRISNQFDTRMTLINDLFEELQDIKIRSFYYGVLFGTVVAVVGHYVLT